MIEKLKKVKWQGAVMNVWKRIQGILVSPAFWVYVFSVLVYLPWFLPTLSQIGPWDETYYLLSGKKLLEGQIPALANSPMSAIFYSLCVLPFRKSPFWLVQANSLGRFLLFSGLFLGVWKVGQALKEYFNPLILLGFLFLSPILTSSYEYPADPLFITFSAFAFSQAVLFLKTKSLKRLRWASFWLGIGMLTRGDALFISLPFFVLMIFVGWKDFHWLRLFTAAVLPFAMIVTGFILTRGMLTGDFQTGMAGYSYTVFEQGQEADLPGGDQRFGNATESFYVARDRFGTPEENDHSVFEAIMRNPQAYFRRVKGVLSWIPGLYLSAYYRRYTPFITLLAIRGLFSLLQKKDYSLTLLHLVWILPIGAGILRTLYRMAYFQMFLFVVFSLAAIGLNALLDSLKKDKEWLFWVGALIVMMVIAYKGGELGIQFAMLIYLGWLVFSWLTARKSTVVSSWKEISMLLLLAGGLFLRVDYPIFQPRILGHDHRERGSLMLREVTDPGAAVLTGTPSVVLMANREVANFSAADIPEFESSEVFIEWMRVQDFEAVYLDREAPNILWELVFDQSGKALREVWSTENEDAYIFLLD